MLSIIIGSILIFLGLCLIPTGYAKFKEELKMVKEETSILKRIFIYLITIIGFFDFDSYLGWHLVWGYYLLLVVEYLLFLRLCNSHYKRDITVEIGIDLICKSIFNSKRRIIRWKY